MGPKLQKIVKIYSYFTYYSLKISFPGFLSSVWSSVLSTVVCWQYQTGIKNETEQKELKPFYTSYHYQQNRKNHDLAGHQALPSAVLQ